MVQVGRSQILKSVAQKFFVRLTKYQCEHISLNEYSLFALPFYSMGYCGLAYYYIIP